MTEGSHNSFPADALGEKAGGTGPVRGRRGLLLEVCGDSPKASQLGQIAMATWGQCHFHQVSERAPESEQHRGNPSATWGMLGGCRG